MARERAKLFNNSYNSMFNIFRLLFKNYSFPVSSPSFFSSALEPEPDRRAAAVVITALGSPTVIPNVLPFVIPGAAAANDEDAEKRACLASIFSFRSWAFVAPPRDWSRRRGGIGWGIKGYKGWYRV